MDMAPTDIRVGSQYVRDNDKNGELFEVIDVDLQAKDAGDANWHPAVMYRSLSAGDNIRRVRTMIDFCNKFSLPPEENSEEEDTTA